MTPDPCLGPGGCDGWGCGRVVYPDKQPREVHCPFCCTHGINETPILENR